jgi:hypothetical protein
VETTVLCAINFFRSDAQTEEKKLLLGLGYETALKVYNKSSEIPREVLESDDPGR